MLGPNLPNARKGLLYLGPGPLGPTGHPYKGDCVKDDRRLSNENAFDISHGNFF